MPASLLAISAASGRLSGSSRACASASLNRSCASASWPAENAIVPSTQLRSGDSADSSTTSRRVKPRDSSASIRCIAAVSIRLSRSARAGEMSEAHRRCVAARARRPSATSSPARRSNSAARPSSGCSSAATRCSHDADSLTTEAARSCSTRRLVAVIPAYTASRTSRWRISTGHVGSAGHQFTRPAFTAGSMAALGESTCAAWPSWASGMRRFRTDSISTMTRVSGGSTRT